MFEKDICFCTNFECEHKDCRRHQVNTPQDESARYITKSHFECDEDGNCKFYYKRG